MKILITGNLGYVGPVLVKELRKKYPDAILIGYDLGFFSKYLTTSGISPDSFLDIQYYGDVRNFPERYLQDVDTVVHLAAISNDPIGNRFEDVTLDINYKATLDIAKKAKSNGVKSFVFASSCSVYGFAEDGARTETSTVNPLTAYAKSKVLSEEGLSQIADENFTVTCLRFATACGFSERLRLDLVLNDFVAGALTAGEITILSDGTPWRPLINVKDMARAIIWSHERTKNDGGSFLVVNAGSNQWNYQVKELARAIQEILPETKVSINKDAQPDKRSYKVDFSLFNTLAPDYQPIYDLQNTIHELILGLKSIDFKDQNFRTSNLIRLIVINELKAKSIVDSELRVVQSKAERLIGESEEVLS
ncbi:MAG TPA: SDR family oxidoreductase [Cytophagales bacterium]|nr:SDR family oxidoreductase [Cytophagales bacterium]